MENSKLLVILVICVSFKSVWGKGYFIATCPETIKMSTKFPVLVASSNFDKPETLQLQIIGKLDSGKFRNYSQTITLSNNQIQRVIFDLQNQPIANYYLMAKLASNSSKYGTRLNLNFKKFSTFIQTDKAIYKAGDKVLFRVIVLDGEMKPFAVQSMRIFITDSAGNRVKQYKKPIVKNGVTSQKFQLSDEVVLGQWQISVMINNSTTEDVGYFEVDEYVLPTFEVNIVTKSDISKTEDLIVSYSAVYTFGADVEGEALVRVELSNIWWWNSDESAVLYEKTLTDTKTVAINLDMENIEYDRTVTVSVIFTEALTGKQRKATKEVIVHYMSYSIEFIGSDYIMKPGIPFELTAFVKDYAGIPVTDTITPVALNVTYVYNILVPSTTTTTTDSWWWVPPQYVEETVIVTKFVTNGIAKFPMTFNSSMSYLRVTAEYKGAIGYFYGYYNPSPSNQYVDVKVDTQTSSSITIKVTCNVKMQYFFYMVVAGGKIVAGSRVAVQNSPTQKFTFNTTSEMKPRSNIVVFYMTSEGEIVSDRVELDFSYDFNNFVKISLSKTQAKPSENISLTINSQPSSFVGLLGVDQSVLLLKSGNDITGDLVKADMNRYTYPDRFNYDWFAFPANYYYEDFSSLSLAVVTNINNEGIDEPNFTGGDVWGGGEAEPSTTIIPPPDSNGNNNGFGNGDGSQNIKTRSDFRETWLFEDIDNVKGSSSITRKVPDSITSWIITGFSVNANNGFGITNNSSKLTVFMPFFITLNYPYSVKRGETVSIEVIVFNYMKNDANATVTLFNDNKEFDFTEERLKATDPFKTKIIFAKANGGTLTTFLVKPLKSGYIKLKCEAKTSTAGDRVERPLLVIPEGVTEYVNDAVFVDLRNTSSFSQKINITIPSNAVPDSTKIDVTVTGDVMTPMLKSLNNLIQMPHGCGEQNMITFVPNIVALDYLRSIKQNTTEIETQVNQNLEAGYQRQLTYKHGDGSYSAFGGNDGSGSTWLTAFVAKSFNQASKYILIDQNVLDQALDFLTGIQASDGSFPEVGIVFHTAMQGGASKGIGLTSYVLTTFLEVNKNLTKYGTTINKTIDFIVKNLNQTNDAYTLAIVSYALQLAKHSMAKSAFDKFQTKSTTVKGMKYWKVTSTVGDPSFAKSNPESIEATAYGLIVTIDAARTSDIFPIARWLVGQRNENGGFHSTQDTVVGLQALSKIKLSSAKNNIKVYFTYGTTTTKPLIVNSAKSLILQSLQIPASVRSLSIYANGTGYSVVQVSYRYNMNKAYEASGFFLSLSIYGAPESGFNLTACAQLDNSTKVQRSNMAVMEASTPSGYTFDASLADAIVNSSSVIKRVDFKEGNTLAVVYFDYLTPNQVCPQFGLTKSFDVENVKPASVVVYDYYNPNRVYQTFYTPNVIMCITTPCPVG